MTSGYQVQLNKFAPIKTTGLVPTLAAGNEITFLPKSNFKQYGKNSNIKIFFKTVTAVFKLAILIVIFTIPFAISSYNIIAPQSSYAASIEIQPPSIKSEEIIKLTNLERKKHNLNELKYSPQLARLAEIRIIDMKAQHYFSHTNPQGEGLRYFLKQIDYDYLIAGENLAINFYDNHEVVQAWMGSSSHKNNILNPLYKEIGVWHGIAEIGGKDRMIIAMILGRER